jgi:glycosyltransferase involved in cell wall biosynthesis
MILEMIVKTKIIYLYREVMPYNVAVFKELVKRNCILSVVQDDFKKLTPYVPPEVNDVTYYNKSNFNQKKLTEFVLNINPDILFISDRTIPMYNKIGVLIKKRNIPVISGNDTPWYGGKQWLNVLTSFARHKRYFSHVLVAGMRQYEYTKKLGFPNNRILFPLYSADISIFNELELNQNRFKNARDILFVGRFNKVKGLDLLLEAWKQVENKNGSKLIIVGNGDLLDNCFIPEDVEIKKFASQPELLTISKSCKAFILPSLFEPWGVVIHEFAASGLPLIVTDVCGASSHLVVNNYNGFVIKHNDVNAIIVAITSVFNLKSVALYEMGKNSRELANTINPKLAAAAVLSAL